jgi:hypothetical protein
LKDLVFDSKSSARSHKCRVATKGEHAAAAAATWGTGNHKPHSIIALVDRLSWQSAAMSDVEHFAPTVELLVEDPRAAQLAVSLQFNHLSGFTYLAAVK